MDVTVNRAVELATRALERDLTQVEWAELCLLLWEMECAGVPGPAGVDFVHTVLQKILGK